MFGGKETAQLASSPTDERIEAVKRIASRAKREENLNDSRGATMHWSPLSGWLVV
jgi:hypothetical protein